jgi:hypothetical protein
VSTLPAIPEKRRRSSRLNQAVPLTVQGADSASAPYVERVSTLTISCHGCKYRSEHKVLPDEVVLLALEDAQRRATGPSRARVKQVQQLAATDKPFEVVLELESPGNIWEIPAPPEDWVEFREPAGSEAGASGLRVMPRNEAQAASAAGGISQLPSERIDAPFPASAFLTQFMQGLDEQIRAIARESAAAAMTREKSKLFDEFRTQLHGEAARTLERGGDALRELNAAHEGAARSAYERWTKKLEQDFGETAQRSVSLGGKVNERVEKAAQTTFERAQQNMDTSRRDTLDQFRTQLRTEVTPLLDEAQSALQKLSALQDEVKVRSLEICGQFSEFLKEEARKSSADIQQRISEGDQQFRGIVQARLVTGSEEMGKQSAQAVNAFADTLRKRSEECDQAAQGRLKSLGDSNANQAAGLFQERIAQLSSQFAKELDGYRSYLQLISASIAEIAKKPIVRSQE